MARPVRPAYFLTLSFSTSTNAPVAKEDRDAVPKRTSLPRVVIGLAVAVRRPLCRAALTSLELVVGRELDGLAKPVKGRPDWETGRTAGSKDPELPFGLLLDD